METETALSRREALLRSAATTSLAGIALVQAIALPSLFVQGRQFGVLSIAAMLLCVGLGLALTAAPAGATWLWRTLAGGAGLVFAGWAVPRLYAIPGMAHQKGHWAAMPGAVAGGLAAACVVLAVVAAPPTRSAVRGLATAAVVLLATAPGVGALLVAVGPGLAGGEKLLATGAHIHSHGSGESAIVFRPLPGGGGHYVYLATPTAHQTAFGLALLIAAAFVFTYGAVAYLRRRTAPAAPASPTTAISNLDLERSLA
jgi:hypothetical protein